MPDQPPAPALGLLLRQLHQQWTQSVDAALDAAGFDDIRPSHSNVFAFTPPEGIQVSELTKLARIRKQSITQAVEELEKLGYVERRPDPSDKRARLVFLTSRGQSVQPIAVAAGRQVQRHWEEVMGQEDIDALGRMLQTLLYRLQKDR
jgi:DNA-binding MarR family transcriptional regulator